ncbi:hypothetical protein B5X24_HaOG209489 [Helicoverpa armigera]|uniref:Uncharacterized protein n=1 Tax=Helicoverpa armigera TaxID=29058 RepID=A0A2W1BFA1_HELAM|nr:hypothetical protein B5X24_HaOG209489 [Helicoverpa armigera]
MSRRAVSEARGAASARRLPRPAPARSLSCIPIVSHGEHCPTKRGTFSRKYWTRRYNATTEHVKLFLPTDNITAYTFTKNRFGKIDKPDIELRCREYICDGVLKISFPQKAPK